MKFNYKLVLSPKMLLFLNLSTLLITGFVCLSWRSETKGRKLSILNKSEIISNPMVNWKLNYEKTLEHLKKSEGFADGKIYICPGGYKTIGYGHVVLEGENFVELTKYQADSLLRVDFNRALSEVDKIIKLPGMRRLAIAHFVFTKGIGTFINSGLKDKIKNGESINDDLLEFCYYSTIDGKKIKSQHAYKTRKWELDLYYNKS